MNDRARLDPGAVDALLQGRHGDPFAVLGPHQADGQRVVRTLQPGAQAVEAIDGQGQVLAALPPLADGLFAGEVPGQGAYRLRVHWPTAVQDLDDPYAFGTMLEGHDLDLLAQGQHPEVHRQLGAHPLAIEGVPGVRFAVWAPNARRVSVVGDFNQWDGRRHPMRLRLPHGVWELFVPGLTPGARYKYEILGADFSAQQKADPVALATEAPPATASVVAADTPYRWTDHAWMADRATRQRLDAPLSIYELHAASWWRDAQGESPAWDALAERLIPYLGGMGFTHLELLPVAEHPFGGSWGYQPLGQYAPTARFGPPEAFARFVDRCHEAGLGVIVDWVPAHFPTDPHGLAHFDGTPLYEHADPREGFHQDWNTLIYNLGRNEVSGFLIGSALAWLERFHIDGLRVDAVASMLYRDYSRKHGEWVPNIHGGRENLESIAFLKRFNTVVHQHHPGVLTIAEESTAWPGVTRAPTDGGLGFDYKWNMGWMHDTLEYMSRDPIHRRWHHHEMTFSMVYAYSEHYVLPLSHDEVVHGKRSLLGRMPGDDWQRFANLRAYYGFMWAHPGKKLLFAGAELAQPTEWNHDAQLPWELLDDPRHRGVQQLLRDLNRLLAREPALHAWDGDPRGFRWAIGDDAHNSVFAWLRFAEGARPALVVSNLTPTPLHDYRIGVPLDGRWVAAINSDDAGYGGSGAGQGEAHAEPVPIHGQPWSLALTLPPLATVIYLAEQT
ncbi:1,4-alpha-glucan branching protein GlgB [Frateuria sp. STR12]|uniref:1,4-alpha-glucan branching protein GlgB n=1 Tax=Frateuria hangzhouensis TaxID=2995589 RepID=UPI002260C865|nr:1,4-alpha-glucan branching protein GlgB [Frateuria sp. STR12]MCX7512189.1 1,4-alpha-glucan branching protein GlgB [Frateuria sp. STR12]